MWFSRRAWVPAFAGMTLVLLLGACGFHLRGDAPMGLKSLYVSSEGPSQVAIEVRRTLTGTPTKIAKAAAEGEAHLRILSEVREKNIYTITGAGRVYEFQLRLLVSYQMSLPGQEEPVIPATQIELRRQVTYSETAPLAKEAEEQLLYKDMVTEASSQILRRIALLRHAG